MNVLLIGGAGFIGSHTADALLARGHDVRVLDSLESRVHTNAWPAHMDPRLDLVSATVTDRTALANALTGIDAVFNFAAYQDYLTDFSRFFITNSVGTALLYEVIVDERLPIRKVIVASSQAVFGEGMYRCPEHGLQQPGPRPREQLERGDWGVVCQVCGVPSQLVPVEERFANPQTSYGLSKRLQEDIALTLGRQYGIPSVALRYSIVQGPRQSLRNAYSGALRSFTMRALCGRAPVLFEDGGQLRDYVSIHDVVRANVLALEDSRTEYEAFNVGGDRRVSVRELARMVLDAAGVDIRPEVPGLFRVGDSRHIVSDIAKLRRLGWQPLVSQNDIVREYVAWAAAEPNVRDAFADAKRHMIATGVLQTRWPEAA
jgi:dTDP-L-rhamnose 4-epimerase